jgi:hypothetical protein
MELNIIQTQFGKVLNVFKIYVYFVNRIWSISLSLAPSLIDTWFLLIAFLAGSLTPKIEASTFLRNVGGFLPDYMALQSWRLYSSLCSINWGFLLCDMTSVIGY